MLREKIGVAGRTGVTQVLGFLFAAAFIAFTNPAQAVFIGDGNGNLYGLDVNTNAATFIGAMSTIMTDIGMHPTTGALYGTDGSSLYSINTGTAATSLIGGTNPFINGLAFDASGVLYGSGGTNLYTVNLTSGVSSLVGSTGFGSSGDLAFDANGNLYLSSTFGSDGLVSLNPLTGAGTFIGGIGFLNVYGLNFVGPTLFGFTAAGDTLTINTGTGAGTSIASNGLSAFGADGLNPTPGPGPGPGPGPTSLPEPATSAMFIVGLVGFVVATRRRKAAANRATMRKASGTGAFVDHHALA